MDESLKSCWICLSDESQNDEGCGKWVKPCLCKGSLKYVHEQCLLCWISVKMSQRQKVCCPACQYTYVIECRSNLILRIFECVDRMVCVATPYAVIVGASIVLYVLMTVYGLHTVFMVFGVKDGSRILGYPKWDWRLWISLPVIPASLLMARTNTSISHLFMALIPTVIIGTKHKNYSMDYRALSMYIMPWTFMLYDYGVYFIKDRICGDSRRQLLENENSNSENNIYPLDTQEIELQPEISRHVISTLLFPMLSSLFGTLLQNFTSISTWLPSVWQRSAFGGCVISLLNDIVSIIYCKKKCDSIKSRRVLDCTAQFLPSGTGINENGAQVS